MEIKTVLQDRWIELRTHPGDPDFVEALKVINGIHPDQAYETKIVQLRHGPYLREIRDQRVTLIKVMFEASKNNFKMFGSVKLRPQYKNEIGREPRLIDCDGHRIEETHIEYISVGIVMFDPYAEPRK